MGRRKRSGGPAFSLFAFQDIITCVMGIMLLLTLMMAVQLSATTATSRNDQEIAETLQQLEQESADLLAAIAIMERQVKAQAEELQAGALLNNEFLRQSHREATTAAEESREESDRVSALLMKSQQELEDTRKRSESVPTLSEQIRVLETRLAQQQQELKLIKSGTRLVYNRHSSDAMQCWILEISSATDIRAGLMGSEQASVALADIPAAIAWIADKSADDTAFMLLVKPDAADSLETLSEYLIERKRPFGFDLLPQQTRVLPREVRAE